MFAGCSGKMAANPCGTRSRRGDCSFDLPEALGMVLSSWLRASEAPAPAAPAKPAVRAWHEAVGDGVGRDIGRRETPVRREVERHLERLLGAGPVRIDEVARAMGYGRQTLYRRLKAEGATFEQVLADLRRRIALRLVRDEGVPVKEVAWRLGFSDSAAFSRAFKRWTGASPSKLSGRKFN